MTPEMATAELAPARPEQQLPLRDIFGDGVPVELDLGCGDGAFLVAMALANSRRGFLGVERMIGRVRSACSKIVRSQLRNARVMRSEIPAALDMLPDASIAVCHLLFPDPWPKRRHHRRRVITTALLSSIARVLQPGGTLHIATDDAEYFRAICSTLGAAEALRSAKGDAQDEYPVSTFEKRFRAAGLPIYRLRLSKYSCPRKASACQERR